MLIPGLHCKTSCWGHHPAGTHNRLCSQVTWPLTSETHSRHLTACPRAGHISSPVLGRTNTLMICHWTAVAGVLQPTCHTSHPTQSGNTHQAATTPHRYSCSSPVCSQQCWHCCPENRLLQPPVTTSLARPEPHVAGWHVNPIKQLHDRVVHRHTRCHHLLSTWQRRLLCLACTGHDKQGTRRGGVRPCPNMTPKAIWNYTVLAASAGPASCQLQLHSGAHLSRPGSAPCLAASSCLHAQHPAGGAHNTHGQSCECATTSSPVLLHMPYKLPCREVLPCPAHASVHCSLRGPRSSSSGRRTRTMVVWMGASASS